MELKMKKKEKEKERKRKEKRGANKLVFQRIGSRYCVS